jgi:hypothetical protein
MMIIDERLEAAAKALHALRTDEFPWDELSPMIKDEYRKEARAVINAWQEGAPEVEEYDD